MSFQCKWKETLPNGESVCNYGFPFPNSADRNNLDVKPRMRNTDYWQPNTFNSMRPECTADTSDQQERCVTGVRRQEHNRNRTQPTP